MNIDNKLSLFKNFMSECRFGLDIGKNTLKNTTVTSTEQKSVQMDLGTATPNKHQSESKKEEKKQEEQKTFKKVELNPNDEASKKINMKLLNLI